MQIYRKPGILSHAAWHNDNQQRPTSRNQNYFQALLLLCWKPTVSSSSTVPFCFFSSAFKSRFWDSNCSIWNSSPAICSSAPTLNSSMILKKRQRRRMMTSEATSSSTPCRSTSVMKPARMTMASKMWNLELKYLCGRSVSGFMKLLVESYPRVCLVKLLKTPCALWYPECRLYIALHTPWDI